MWVDRLLFLWIMSQRRDGVRLTGWSWDTWIQSVIITHTDICILISLFGSNKFISTDIFLFGAAAPLKGWMAWMQHIQSALLPSMESRCSASSWPFVPWPFRAFPDLPLAWLRAHSVSGVAGEGTGSVLARPLILTGSRRGGCHRMMEGKRTQTNPLLRNYCVWSIGCWLQSYCKWKTNSTIHRGLPFPNRNYTE